MSIHFSRYLWALTGSLALFASGLGEAQVLQSDTEAAVDPALREANIKARAQMPRIVNRVAASVNGRPITSNELSFMMLPLVSQLAAQYPRQGAGFYRELGKIKNKILDDLIDRELVLGEFDEMGATFPDAIIDQEVARMIRESFNGDREKFVADLAREGLTIRGYRDLTKRRLIVMSMRAQKYDMDLPPTPAEIQQEYNKTKSNYRDQTKDKIKFEKILISVLPGSENNDPEVQLALAELIVEQLKSGKATFADLAKNYSNDIHAEDGGQWPEMERGDLAADFAGILFDSPEGVLVGPLADSYGFTIVRVQKITKAPAPPLSAVKKLVDDQVRRMKSAERYDRWIKRLRESATIKKYI